MPKPYPISTSPKITFATNVYRNPNQLNIYPKPKAT